MEDILYNYIYLLFNTIIILFVLQSIVYCLLDEESEDVKLKNFVKIYFCIVLCVDGVFCTF